MTSIVVMGRLPRILACLLLAGPSCVVGPQYDPLDSQPTDRADDDASGRAGDEFEEPGVEGEAEPPVGIDTGFLPDDGGADPWSGDEDGESDDAVPGEQVTDELVPGVPVIPRPGPPSPVPSSSPLDSAEPDPGDPSPDCDDDGESVPHDEPPPDA